MLPVLVSVRVSRLGRHPVFENREVVSYCTFALGYESRKETRLFVRVGVVVGVGVVNHLIHIALENFTRSKLFGW